MATLVKNKSNFIVIKLSKKEAHSLGWGINNDGTCICGDCNKIIKGDIYYPIVLCDTYCKKCYEKQIKDATNYEEDRPLEKASYMQLKKYLNIKED